MRRSRNGSGCSQSTSPGCSTAPTPHCPTCCAPPPRGPGRRLPYPARLIRQSSWGGNVQERLGIAGSGTIATGLAISASTAVAVVLWARSDSSAERARAAIAKGAGRLEGADAERVQVVTDLDELAQSTFLVEAVVEHHGSKAEVLSDLGDLAREQSEEAILA